MSILAREHRVLHYREIILVKVLWEHHKKVEATWEIETEMYERYPFLFNL